MDQTEQHSEQIKTKTPVLSEKNLKIGELLVRDGFVREKDIQKALDLQRQEKELRGQPLGEILLKTSLLKEPDLRRLMEHPELKQSVGTLAVERGLISRDQLQACLQKRAPGQMIGEVFVNEGLLTPEDLGGLLKEQMNAPKLGELAVKLNLISEKDLETALKIQKFPRVLGEILCDLNLVNPLDLYYVLNKYKKQFKLGEMLLKMGYIDEVNLNKALQEQKHSSGTLGEILLSKRLITHEQLQTVLSKQANIPFKSLQGFAYSEEDKRVLTSIISQKYAEKNFMIPISLVGKVLTLALLRPEKIHTARELKALYSNLTIQCVLITEEKFGELFEVLYSRRLGGLKWEEDTTEEAEGQNLDFMQVELNEEMEGANDDGPVYDAQDLEAEELVNFIIKYGISNGASDVHLEQDREGAKLRYRIDGVLTEVSIDWLKRKLQEKVGSIISRIKIISNLDIAERRLPQDGVFRINYYDKAKGKKFDLDFRVATCRAITGENVTIRILDSRKASVGLENLNHSPHVLEPFMRFLKSAAGMILVSGPTGSGKSSTLYGALKYIYNPELKIITAEDPIEYNFPGIMQTQVHTKIDLTFARLLRSFLRLDPDVILVGEIRDEETARIGFDAAQTGHLMLSTIHTNDSVSSIGRLLDLGVERSQMASCLLGVLAQRLLRRICPSCIKEYIPDEHEWVTVFDRFPSHLKFYKGQGCEVCGFSGYKGRTLISEIFTVDKEISKALSRNADVDEIKALAVDRGMKTMMEDSLLKLEETTLSEIIRVVPHEMIQAFRMRNGQGRQVEEKHLVSDLKPQPGGFLLSDPKMEQATIARMHERYEMLVSQNGSEPGKVDRGLFSEFVTESFHEVCQHHHCSQVIFNIEDRSGKVEITAISAN